MFEWFFHKGKATMYSRNKMISEMIVQIRGVFQHYTDQQLAPHTLEKIEGALQESIPTEYTSAQWEDFAARYDEMVEKQS